MTEEETKKDELLVLRLIEEGIERMSEIQKRLQWSQERVENTVETLRENNYIETAEKAGERALEITAQGQKEIPKLMREVLKESREFIKSVSETFEKRASKILPEIDIEVNVGEEGEETVETYTCEKCDEEFESEEALGIHKGSEHSVNEPEE